MGIKPSKGGLDCWDVTQGFKLKKFGHEFAMIMNDEIIYRMTFKISLPSKLPQAQGVPIVD